MTEEVLDVEVVTDQEPAELSAEQKRIRRRGLASAAVALATQHRWDESITVNQEILEMFPDDPEANNRVGNAMSELGRVSEAIEAYETTIQAQPTNAIAGRNLVRLRQIAESGGDVGAKASQKLPSSFFIEEVGKTGITSLVDLAPAETLVLVTAGDELEVKAKRNKLEVSLTNGTFVGRVEPDLAERLIRLMKGGNKYQAGVIMADGTRFRILIRETHQSPDQEGRISFPPRTASDVRGYTREGLIRREDEDESDDAGDSEGEESDEDEESGSEFGYGESASGRE